MNNIPVATRIDLLAGAILNLADALEDVVARLPEADREGPDFADIQTYLAGARQLVERCRRGSR